MNKTVCSLLALALLAGCAGMNRPKTGPGSGYGAGYVPSVEPSDTPAPVYEAAVQKCQGWASDIPYMRSGKDDEALFVVGVGTGLGIVFGTALVGIDLVAASVVGGSGLYGFQYWTETPERQAWYARQETMMMNCMAREGYTNNDPSVKVTWRKFDPNYDAPRLTGRDTYNAERIAKARSCGIAPMATLVSKGPGFENYNVPCEAQGNTLQVRCEFGNCRETGAVAGLAPRAVKVSQK